MTKGTWVQRQVLLALVLELLDKVVDKTVVEVLTTQVSVACGSLDFEDTVFNRQEGNIESSPSEIENKDVTLAADFLVKTISDGGGSRLVDDTKDVHARNGTSILGGLTLRVVEVCGNGNDSVIARDAEIRLSGLFHLQEHHGRDFFGGLENQSSQH